MNQPVENEATSQSKVLEEEATTIAFDGGSAEQEGEDVSADYQQEVGKLEQAIWHAPQGKGTKIMAVIILTLLFASIIAMLVMGIISATG